MKGPRKQHERDASNAQCMCDNFFHSLLFQSPDKLPLELLIYEGLGPVLIALLEFPETEVPCGLDNLPRSLARIYLFP